ncbi:MAG: hypothetical protein K0Q49_2046 [Haloplasmataceae bacterium]|jgi:uncharacterized protein YxjI|nr:hypothetical protein [Haloplasmataceae bacterium]
MIKLFIPKKNIQYNNHRDVLDEKDNLVYRNRGNFFQTKIKLLNRDDTIIYEARMAWSLKRRYDIFKNGEKVSYIIAQSIFNSYNYNIVSFLENLGVVGSITRSEFRIFKDDQVVLSISKDVEKKYYRIIDIDELHTEFLLMLMFTLIVAADTIDTL